MIPKNYDGWMALLRISADDLWGIAQFAERIAERGERDFPAMRSAIEKVVDNLLDLSEEICNEIEKSKGE